MQASLSVDLCCSDSLVSQNFLHLSKLHARVQMDCRDARTQSVRGKHAYRCPPTVPRHALNVARTASCNDLAGCFRKRIRFAGHPNVCGALCATAGRISTYAFGLIYAEMHKLTNALGQSTFSLITASSPLTSHLLKAE